MLRHAVASELRRRGVPGWVVSGLIGHKKGKAAATTGGYAKHDPAYFGKARKALDAWLTDLAKDVPWLRVVSAGAAGTGNSKARARKPRRCWFEGGGRYKDRTCDPYHVKVVLYR